MSLNKATVSKSDGADSIRILIQSQKIGMVVNITRMEKRNVQIGSAIFHSGLK